MPRNHPIEQFCRSYLSYLLSILSPLYLPRPVLRFLHACPRACLPACRSFVPRRLLFPCLVRPGCSYRTRPPIFLSFALPSCFPLSLALRSDNGAGFNNPPADTLFPKQKSLTDRCDCGNTGARPSGSIGIRSLSSVTYDPGQPCFKIPTVSWRVNRVIVLEVV